MKVRVIQYLLMIVCTIQINSVFSQDLSTIFEQKPFTFSGSLNVNQMATYRNVSYSSENPYSIFLSGNATFTFYGISAPFNFSYSNQQTNYSHPFSYNEQCQNNPSNPHIPVVVKWSGVKTSEK